jgi:hypothetical protein
MRDYWSEDGDILVHERRGRSFGWLLVLIATVGVGFLAVSTWLVGLLGNVMLWFFVALEFLSFIRREEFDRRTNIMRRQGVLGLEWTEPLNRFAYVRVFRGFTGRGTRKTCVNLGRREPRETAMMPEYTVAVYFYPSEGDEKEARQWGQRLALFLNLPLRSEP